MRRRCAVLNAVLNSREGGGTLSWHGKRAIGQAKSAELRLHEGHSPSVEDCMDWTMAVNLSMEDCMTHGMAISAFFGLLQHTSPVRIPSHARLTPCSAQGTVALWRIVPKSAVLFQRRLGNKMKGGSHQHPQAISSSANKCWWSPALPRGRHHGGAPPLQRG